MHYKLLEEHIRSLTRHLDIDRLHTDAFNRCRASYDRRVFIRPIRGTITYAVALHEIGHCQTFERAGWTYAVESPEMRMMNAEALAWQWAREKALLWTRSMHLTMLHSFNSHRKRFLRGAKIEDVTHKYMYPNNYFEKSLSIRNRRR